MLARNNQLIIVIIDTMPIYVYEVITKDGSQGETFEAMQPMSADPLKTHPETGEPVRRVLQAPNIGTRYSERQLKSKLDTKSVEKQGFTKYEKDKLTGTYHRTAGTNGPETLRP